MGRDSSGDQVRESTGCMKREELDLKSARVFDSRVTHVKTLPSPLKIEPVGRLVSDQVLGMLLSNRCSP